MHNYPESLLVKIYVFIPGTYILVTHNSDFGVDIQHHAVQQSPKLVHWYGQNIPSGNNTQTTTPIGLENRHHGRQFPKYYMGIMSSGIQQKKKELVATASFRPRNGERTALLQYLLESKASTSWVTTGFAGYSAATHEGWLYAHTEYKFAFSPPGNGINCHQTWEMLLLGVIPMG